MDLEGYTILRGMSRSFEIFRMAFWSTDNPSIRMSILRAWESVLGIYIHEGFHFHGSSDKFLSKVCVLDRELLCVKPRSLLECIFSLVKVCNRVH